MHQLVYTIKHDPQQRKVTAVPDVPEYTSTQLTEMLEERCLPDVQQIVYQPRAGNELVLFSLYLSILENASAINVLIDVKKGRQGFPLLRAMWEASLDIELLVQNDDHMNNMWFAHTKFWLKQIQVGASGNPFVESLGALPDANDHLSKLEAELEKLRSKGGRELPISRKCELLGRTAEYQTVYAMLSNYGHNNLQALMSQHFELDEPEGIRLAAFNQTTDEDVQLLLDGVLGVLRNTSRLVHQRFNTGLEAGYT